ncbi:hypothetical protein Y032_0106g3724 [Ancylostoma ceylanicum]|uniref:Uncharacterized protein n=1 Tax=Ancylostoma ceylanicum TaxID=53326 RepID=A0A016TFV5_9BILA|nr:hypothetical protein Y032_0106g3724 [Ancylostoma ceylanicum]
MAEQSIDEEMEAMILMEADEGKRIADLQVQVAGLTQQLRELTEKQAPQAQSDQPSTSGIQPASFREAMMQVRTNDVPAELQMAEFDPIAAAEETAARERAAKAAGIPLEIAVEEMPR